MSSATAAIGAAGAVADARSETPASRIGFAGVTVAYAGTVALNALTLTVEPGEIMALIGPSGCGKTTALRAVAGFVQPVAGRVLIGDRDVTGLAPYARDIGMVVQNYALFPHMRVSENVAFGLRARRIADADVRQRVDECLCLVGMAGYADRLPRALSGGQQQRVAIARALAIRPRVLLLDEPLSALDAQIRRSMLGELARLHRELPSLTVLYVTHDQSEALTLADRIAILRGGRLVAQGPSERLFHEPPSRFAAEFLGHANLLPVEVVGSEGEAAVLRLGEALLRARQPHGPVGARGLLCLRPHAMSLRREGRENTLTGRVQDVVWHGELQTVEILVAGAHLRFTTTPAREPPLPGSEIAVHFFTDDATLIAEDAAGEA